MQINKIENQTFEGKNFRLSIGDIVYTVNGRTIWSKKSNAVKEYSNPNAKNLYEQAQKAKDIHEKARLYKEMGHYEIKNVNFIEKMKNAFNEFVMKYLF